MDSESFSPAPLDTWGPGFFLCCFERGHDVTALVRAASAKKVPAGCRVVVGNPLKADTFAESVRGHDTLVQLVGVPKPSPWKGRSFARSMDPVRGRRLPPPVQPRSGTLCMSVSPIRPLSCGTISPSAVTVRLRGLRRRGCSRRFSGLGIFWVPEHWWPLALLPVYRVWNEPATREAAMRLGLVSIREMLAALLWSIEHPPVKTRVIEVPEIWRLGRSEP